MISFDNGYPNLKTEWKLLKKKKARKNVKGIADCYLTEKHLDVYSHV